MAGLRECYLFEYWDDCPNSRDSKQEGSKYRAYLLSAFALAPPFRAQGLSRILHARRCLCGAR